MNKIMKFHYQGLVNDIEKDARHCKCKTTKKMLKFYVKFHQEILDKLVEE